MKPLKVGLLGIGTVGSGTFNVLQRNQQEIQRRAGRGIEIAMVADLDVARAQGLVGEGVQVVADARAVLVGVASQDDGPPTPIPGAMRAAIQVFES